MKIALVAHGDNPPYLKELFNGEGFELVEKECNNEKEYIDLLKDADGALIYLHPLTTKEVMEQCSNLKVISRGGVGVDSVDLEAATELGICICNTPGINTTEVADHAMAMLLSLTRKIREQDALVKKGYWADKTELVHPYRSELGRIAGNIVGIVGLGNIGKSFATRIKGFGPAKIIAYDPYIDRTTADLFGVELVELDELLKTSDFITLHAPSTEETHHIINEEAFSKMKSNCILINCARGPLVDPSALFNALKNNIIPAAGIDVTEKEPISSEDPLLSLDNLIITPHTAGSSSVSREVGTRKQAENVIKILKGEAPHGLANPEVIKTIALMKTKANNRWSNVDLFDTSLKV